MTTSRFSADCVAPDLHDLLPAHRSCPACQPEPVDAALLAREERLLGAALRRAARSGRL